VHVEEVGCWSMVLIREIEGVFCEVMGRQKGRPNQSQDIITRTKANEVTTTGFVLG
jgi:hypothetical protein